MVATPELTPRTAVAGQGIFDAGGVLVGHELLFRLPPALRAPVLATEAERELATAEVISAVLDGAAPRGKPEANGSGLLFLNVPRAFLVGSGEDGLAGLDPERVVIEVLESVADDCEVVDGVIALRARGFRIAIDDWTGTGDRDRLVEHAHYVKIDLADVTAERLEEVVASARRLAPEAAVVVERIADGHGLACAQAAGADLYQGFYLEEPT